MKNAFFFPPEQWLSRFAYTWCVGFGCAWPLAMSLGLITRPLPLALCALAVSLGFLLLDCIPRLRFLFYPAAFAAIAAVVLPYAGQLDSIANALTLYLGGSSVALAAYSRPIALLFALFFSCLGTMLCEGDTAFFPTALLCAVMLALLSASGVSPSPLLFLPMIAALLLASRARGVPSLRILLMTGAVLGFCALLMPLAGMCQQTLSDAAKRTQETIEDYLFFTDARTPFSFSQTGWQPLGAERLGGPADPKDTPVMQVRTGGRTLLRGSIRNEYTGLAWADTTSPERYLLLDARLGTLRRNLFDQNHPSVRVLDALAPQETIRVLMNADAASTLFLTQRFSSPAGERLAVYFSPSTEVFGTRSLARGDEYTFSGRRLSSSNAGVRAAVLDAAHTNDPYEETVRSAYLQLPASVESEVYALAAEITQQAATDYDRAAAICGYLQSHYAYTLSQSEPPLTRDFVSWFLLSERKGYCTSFASAMVVLCRSLGIPARYIEGYAAQPDSDGIARVTQQQAHAWAEAYFPGFGWLSFDPTPGAGDSPDGDDPGDDSGSNSEPPPEIFPSPSPTPTPTPTPSPEPTPTPSPTPEHHDPGVTPTPEITPVPTPRPSPTPTPIPPENDDPPKPSNLLWLALALFLLLAFCALRLYLASPAFRASRAKDANAALLVWYAAVCEALYALGIGKQPGEAPASFLQRAQEALGGKPVLSALGKAVCISSFSNHQLKPMHVQKAVGIYQALLRRLGLLGCARLYARRLLRGTYKNL